MLANLEQQKNEAMAAALKLVARGGDAKGKAQLQAFVTHYYKQMDAEDVVSRSDENLLGAAKSHLALADTYKGGDAKVRVYNPTLKEHGWHSPNTVIEIINDDMPFLVDSVTMEVNRQGYTLFSLVHPLYHAKRDGKGKLQELVGKEDKGRAESFIHVELNREVDPQRLQALEEGIRAVLGDVRAAVEDWPEMRSRMSAIIASLDAPPKGVPAEEVDEGRTFLQWAHDNHFTFLGFREYDLITAPGGDRLKATSPKGLGILRHSSKDGFSSSFAELPANVKKMARTPGLLVLTKATSRATVHRPGYLDYIGVKRLDKAGKVIGEWRFVGLYTSSAYFERIHEIPLVRKKAATVLSRAGFAPNSHMGKNLVSILDTYPRDELFQIDTESLFDTALGILQLGDRRKIKVFMRRDLYGRFYSCLIFLPREQFNTAARGKVEDILLRALNGSSAEFTVHLSDALLARIHMLIRTAPSQETAIDTQAIEAEIVMALRDWNEALKVALAEALGDEAASRLSQTYGAAFPVAYREASQVGEAVRDIKMMETLSAAQPFTMRLYRSAGQNAKSLRLRVYRHGAPLPLSGSLPMLENMGLLVQDEQSFEVDRASSDSEGRVHIHDFGMQTAAELADITTVKPLFEEALGRVWRREMESDGFNQLVLAAGLSADEVIVVRAMAKYLKQTGFTFSQTYIESTLAKNSAIARLLADLFHARFDPAKNDKRDAAQAALVKRIEQALNDVVNADEDRILRRFLALTQAIIRTNFYQRKDGQRKAYLSFKIQSAKVPELPEPRPLFEIWVYSPRVEGIHLRFGKVARGGLRWSDRMEDFRTEVLGLVKAQQVKNTVIVPVGSKGGFVVKNPPPASDRDAFMKEGVACYQTFLRGLLDLTDNLIANKLTPPKDVVRHDPDDPYLVVAADKGTATFSDYANAVSLEYGHWLGDAFASGGSVGYDHKKMGITARGAWESVKRHFLEMGIDTQTTEFTVVGVGDMSGDVFGNGMLLSRHIKLVAAFDHRHIFLDPNPDAEKSFKERERMFALPRSSWDDYDKKLISKGGGVFPRSAKTIALTPEIRKVLDVTAESMTPMELMNAILKAPVDLFYNGGIGTYVKASTQSHGEVGDRANDGLRVNGKDLRCKAVAEGGNLGCTQLGRIEYALNGGRINTDAIDNSAGVDCSDHEVNIKILLGIVEGDGKLTVAKRNALLAQMTEEVGELVLQDNYYQTQSLSVSGVRGERMLDAQARFIRHLEKMGRLNRAVEFLPDDEQIAQRRGQKLGLTSPERAVLLAYSKMVLFDQLIESDFIDDPYVAQTLIDYFPKALQKKYADVMPRHALKREIIATMVVNSMVNHVGSVFVFRMNEETGAAPHEVVRAYTLVRDIFGFTKLWADIEALDRKISAKVQNEMLIDSGRLVLRAVLWFLREHHEGKAMADLVAMFQPGVEKLRSKMKSLLDKGDLAAIKARQATLQESGVPAALAEQVAGLDATYAALDIVSVANSSKRTVDQVAEVYFSLVGKLDMRWFANQVNALPVDTHWQALARNAMRDDLSSLQRLLTVAAFSKAGAAKDAPTVVKAWEKVNASALARIADMVADFKSGPALDLAMLSVALREIRGLA